MASSPNFAATALAPDVIQVSTANTALDGSGTIGTLTTGTASGVVIESVTIKAAGTNTAGMIRFFVSVDNGSTKRLVAEVNATATTPSATVTSFTAQVPSLVGLVLLGTTSILYASTEKAEAFNIVAQKSGL